MNNLRTLKGTNPSIAFATLGCRVNQYDTQVLREQAEKASLEMVPFEQKADIYVINTCTVTAAADSEGKQLVRRAKARNPDSFVVVTGCLAQDRPEEVKGLKGVDLVVGNIEKSRLFEKILGAYPHSADWEDESFVQSSSSPWGTGISRFEGHQRAILKVQDGCEFGCSFCLIPRVRGQMASRPIPDILEEGHRLAQNGVKELVLAGIQLSSFGRDWGLKVSQPRLAPAIEELLRIPGIRRVRLSSYAVADFEEALLPLWKSDSGLCAHLHLPLQSGDEVILKAMRRPYSLDRYRETVRQIRQAVPRIGLTSDIIAGFPGETEEAFRNTLDRIRELEFVDFHPFPYSDRPRTPGEAMVPKVDSPILHGRIDRLWELKRECLQHSAERAKGRVCRVIVERHGKNFQSGLTDEGLRVVMPGKEGWLGKEALVMVTGFGEKAALAEWV
ncbi:MAG TPA: tRNA (N(6)-L-threonylcarbamoyladenosine(37)-C(2))-methylthiotransferase MtaB [bacterium]|nr:tRNA (N(6)-L-threonylcarbamoyladenosine(37)-C(2))-methylthiotransferase MtaB [bacterium]